MPAWPKHRRHLHLGQQPRRTQGSPAPHPRLPADLLIRSANGWPPSPWMVPFHPAQPLMCAAETRNHLNFRGDNEMPEVLVVTGASRGIGAATAILGAQKGYAVAVNYNASPDRAEAVVRTDPRRRRHRASPSRPTLRRTKAPAISSPKSTRSSGPSPPSSTTPASSTRTADHRHRRRHRQRADPHQRDEPVPLRPRSRQAHVDGNRRQGRRDRQHVIGGSPPRRRRRSPRLCRLQGRDRYLHPWPCDRGRAAQGIRVNAVRPGPDRNRNP